MEEEKKNIETLVTEAILQKEEEISVGDHTYKVAPPSVATLIQVSEAVSRLPKFLPDEKRVGESVLSLAKDSRPMGEVAAILILGAKHLTETVTETVTREKRRFFGLYTQREEVTVERVIDRKAELTDDLLQLSPRDLHNLIVRLLTKMQIADFFGLSTFLIEVNLLRQTKVENEAN